MPFMPNNRAVWRSLTTDYEIDAVDAVRNGYPFVQAIEGSAKWCWEVPKCPYCGNRHVGIVAPGLQISSCIMLAKRSEYYILPPIKQPRGAEPAIYLATPIDLMTWNVVTKLAKVTDLTIPQAAFVLMQIGVNCLLKAIQRAKAQATTEK